VLIVAQVKGLDEMSSAAGQPSVTPQFAQLQVTSK